MAYLQGLGFSLKPPKWLRDLVNKNVHVNLPPIPPVNVDVRATPTASETAAAAGREAQGLVDQVPGGWVTIGVAAASLLLLMRRPRR